MARLAIATTLMLQMLCNSEAASAPEPELVSMYVSTSSPPSTASQPIFTPRTGQFTGSQSAYFPHVFGNLLPAFEARSTASPKHAVVILPEWWGVSKTEMSIAVKIAHMGHLAVIPNLYRESVPFDKVFDGQSNQSVLAKMVLNEVLTASWKMSNLAWDVHSDHVLDLVAHLKKVQGVQKVVLMGFSEGSCLALLAASQLDRMKQRETEIDGVVSYYGTPLKAGEKFTGNAYRNFNATHIKVPVQLITGAKDPFAGFSDPASMRSIQDAIGALAQYSQIASVDHGFMSNSVWWEAFKASTKPPRVPFSQSAYDEAWSITASFLSRLFHGPTDSEANLMM